MLCGSVENTTIRQSSLGEIAPRSTDEVMRLADRRGLDPCAHGRLAGAPANARNDIGVRARIGQIDEVVSQPTEVQDMGVSVHQAGHDGGARRVEPSAARGRL